MNSCAVCGNAVNGYLCAKHREQLTARLRELPALYAEVGECLVPRQSGWGEIVSTRNPAGPRSPVNEDIIDTVNWGRATEVIHLWRVDVRRERWPHRGAPPAARLGDDCWWLAREMEWIAAQYAAAGELFREVEELDAQARAVVGDPAPRPQRIGLCINVTDDEGTVCGAVLSRLPGEPVTCRWCGTQYRTEQDLLFLLHYQPQSARGASVSR
ncbi:hypothetical protein ACSCBZ_42560 [Streptomyces niveiscabiei]|uniref:hypothetical protein n=1 Tax=Streptomyces niveiscabiei TaxID=164115 RepID=UPI0006EB630D|nr:hypothetical protein [Streptomyces niveiscabiei]